MDNSLNRKKIAVFVSQPDSIYPTQLMYGINAEAYKNNYDVVVFSTFVKAGGTDQFREGEKTIFTLPRPELFDGVIVIPDVIQIEGCLDYIKDNFLSKFDGPITFIDYHGEDYHSTNGQEEVEFEKLVKHVVEEHGCRRVAVMVGPKDHDHSISRLACIEKALAKYDITVNSKEVYYGDFWYHKGEEVARQILDKDTLPDVVMCACDAMAISLCTALRKKNVSVPGDLIITGFDCEGSGVTEPMTVTSIAKNNVSTGIRACQYIVSQLDGTNFNEQEIYSSDIVLNNTCGCKTNIEQKLISTSNFNVSAYDNNPSDVYSEFYSGYNFMNENLMSAVDIWDLLWKLSYYTWYLGDFENLSFCLCDVFDRSNHGLDNDISSSYSDTIFWYYERNTPDKEPIVSLERTFNKSMIFPNIFEPHEHPTTYYIMPVHFNEYCFGYSVLEQIDPEKYINPVFSQWSRNITITLESLRRQTNLKYMYKKFEESTIKDLATNLYSRNGFNLYSKEMLKQSMSYRVPFTLILGDLNCLKYINDVFGHVEGDNAIRKSADAFQIEAKGSVIYSQKNFRIGGDEFVQIIVGKFTKSQCEAHIRKIRTYLDEYNKISGLPYPVYLSIGSYSVEPDANTTIDSILSKADEIMFEDKKRIKAETGFNHER